MSDAQERTEDATEKHLKKVREKGSLQKSRDLMAWLGVAAAAAMIPSTLGSMQNAFEQQLFAVRDVIAAPSSSSAIKAMDAGFGSLAGTLLPLLIVVAVTVVVAAVVQGGIHPRKFTPKWENLDLLKGVKRMFSVQTAWETAKTLAKSAIVAVGFYIVLQTWLPIVTQSGGLSVSALIASGQDGVWALLRTAIGSGLVFSGIDVIFVFFKNRKATRMTKREVKDENKNTEGDPLVKQHRRSRQLSLSRNRMITAVADADVVLVNPTHVAVALKYQAGKSAPKVVAKGADFIATRIREEARAAGVPMVQDIPLARALHKQVKLGQPIPNEYFSQVAHVLAFVMMLRKRGASLEDVLHVPAKRPGPSS